MCFLLHKKLSPFLALWGYLPSLDARANLGDRVANKSQYRKDLEAERIYRFNFKLASLNFISATGTIKVTFFTDKLLSIIRAHNRPRFLLEFLWHM